MLAIQSLLCIAKNSLREHRFLWIAVLFSFGLSMIGANWGVVEDWNPDQVAMKPVPNNLMVADYLKPPLDTYIHRLLVLNPIDIVMKGILHLPDKPRLEARVLGVHILTTLFFCGALVCFYFSIAHCTGKESAAFLTLILGTSAGLLAFNHYGTADSPLLFWMLASFAAALVAATSNKLSFALASGLLAGLAAADKYNGLGVAVAIPSAFFVIQGFSALRNKNFWIAGFTVPLGFVLGVPGAIFDSRHFLHDFLYNLYTTPIYDGDVSHPGYWKFLGCFPELIGWPCTFLLAVCVIVSVGLCCFKRLEKKELLLLISSLAVFIFYFLTIGKFPRIETRFVLPSIPFALLAAAPAITRVNRKLLIGIGILLITYNLLCSVLMGLRYVHDPRMPSLGWAEKNLKAGDLIESVYSPAWDSLIPGIKILKMPLSTGRTQRFKALLGSNSIVTEGVEKFDSDPPLEIFTREALHKRNPDYVTFCSSAIYNTNPDQARQYYLDHLQEKLGYHKIFESFPYPVKVWCYPQHLDFIPDRMVILKKDSNP